MAPISLSMIVRNEAATLRAAVASARAVCREVVIGVDRASDEGTREIARELADVFWTFDFEDDFAARRNDGIGRCSEPWVLILDGHESIYPESLPLIEDAVRAGEEEAECYFATLLMNPDRYGCAPLFLFQPRLFRNRSHLRYEHAVHNALKGFDAEIWKVLRGFKIAHAMPPDRERERKAQRAQMNVAGLLKQLETRPADPRAHYFLGQTYHDLGDHDRAIEWYGKFLNLPEAAGDWDRYQASYYLGAIHSRRGEVAAARKALVRCLDYAWNRAEAYAGLGDLAYERGDCAEALHWHRIAASLPVPNLTTFHDGVAYSWGPWAQMARCHIRQGDYPRAIGCIQRVLEYRPGDPVYVGLLEKVKGEGALRRRGGRAIAVFDRVGSFSGPLIEDWKRRGHEVIVAREFDANLMAWCDLAFVEWCDGNLVAASARRWDRPLIARLHSYEAYSEIPGRVNWRNVDGLVFVAEHIKDRFEREIGAPGPRTWVIPNGVDLGRFTFRERERGPRFAHLGFLNPTKNPALLLQCFAALRERLPDATLHLAGRFQSAEVEHYFRHLTDALHLSEAVRFDGWVETPDAWLEDKHFLLSTSYRESFCYAVAEAMSVGIKPLIHHWPGADALWPPECLFLTVGECVERALGGPYDSERYRTWVARRYPRERQLEAMAEVLGSF